MTVPKKHQLVTATNDKVSTPDRLHRFFEHWSIQTLLGIIGGIVGVFLDGRYFAVLGLSLSYTLYRSKAMQGINLPKTIAAHLILVSMASWGLFWMGNQLNKSRPKTYTPSDYYNALKAGTPTPISQQITNIYTAANSEPDEPVVTLGEWQPNRKSASGLLWTSETVNTGSATAIGTKSTGVGFIMKKSKESEDSIFKYLETRAFDKYETKVDLPPGKSYSRHSLIYSPPETAENVESIKSGEKVVYLPLVVSYEDKAGKAYLSELCMYVGTEVQALRYCQAHNGIKSATKP